MDIPERIFKAYDIRAIYPTELNEENIVPILKAFYVFFTQKVSNERPLTVALSYDMRLSGPQLFDVAKKTLVSLGAQVIDAGMQSTPSFYFTVSHYGYDCGIQITASHNPKEWNGMKSVINSPSGLIKIGKSTGMDQIKEMAMHGVEFTPRFTGNSTQKTGIIPDEVETALKNFNYPAIKKFKLVADPANAMGAQYISAIFDKIPADLVKMNFELDGSFPVHQPDPLNFENLKDLQKKVLEEKADFGLAPDGDGDRLYFIDEKGQVVPATLITSLIARELLKEQPGSTILVDIRYINGSRKIIEENGGKFELTKVGHAYITEGLGKVNGIFAGESSGHFFYRMNGNAESQLTTIILILKILSETGKTLSQLCEEVHRSFESGEFNFKVANAAAIIEAVKNKYTDGELSTLDGISISYPTWRFNIRTSNTEPLLRLNLESFDKSEMEVKRDELIALINSLAVNQ